ncbi:MAG: 3-phosphoshikimate 1-carboxyvinyltransferase [Candidatus Omnitrophota bacterium]|nr:3-phosphoshikimate 1-carboxyvinyltransferase [Candidatus Omnitrophota bacterium]
MRFFSVRHASCVKGEILLLGDKSIASRAIIISAISCGKTTVENFPPNKDCLYTIKTFKNLGIKITHQKVKTITVFGNGLCGLKKPKGPIFLGDSGTTLRLTLGVLAGQNFAVTLTAGKSLSVRPMLRVTAPLRMMGAEICARHIPKTKNLTPNTKFEEYPPITIKGGYLNPLTYKIPLASAQVKSAILLAGLYAKGKTCVIEPVKTRDHTERMLRLFKAGIKVSSVRNTKALREKNKISNGVNQNTIVIEGKKELVSPGRIFIPGDISSAAFFMVLGTILPNSRILIKDISLNPSRIGIIKVLKRMGADIQAVSCQLSADSYEPMGHLIVKSSKLTGIIVKETEIPSLIDELPILMVAACFAIGKSVFEGVEELRIKETDRIISMSENLKKMGADIRVLKMLKSEKIIIQGGRTLMGATVKSFGDHRTAMSMTVAGLAAEGKTRIDNITCINKSFPGFLNILKTLIR